MVHLVRVNETLCTIQSGHTLYSYSYMINDLTLYSNMISGVFPQIQEM